MNRILFFAVTAWDLFSSTVLIQLLPLVPCRSYPSVAAVCINEPLPAYQTGGGMTTNKVNVVLGAGEAPAKFFQGLAGAWRGAEGFSRV